MVMLGAAVFLLAVAVSQALGASVSDLCGGNCPFVPDGTITLDPAPSPGKTTVMTLPGEFKEEFKDGKYVCKNYYSLFIWVSAGDAEGDPCTEGFTCPVEKGQRTESIKLDVPADAPAGNYKSECAFTTSDGQKFADVRILFSIK